MSHSAHILVVDDEPNIRLSFLAALAPEGYTLTAAEDGESALRWLGRERFDLVLLDLRMPGMGGMELLRRLREAGFGAPVVIVSAHDAVPNVVQAVRLGAVDFLPKPTTPAALRAAVAGVLARERPAPPAGAAPRPEPEPAPPPAEALARAKAALGRRDFDAAGVALDEAVRLDGRCAEAHYLRGVLHEMHGERHAAYSSYRAALLADPGHEPSKLQLMMSFSDRMM